jgi:FkbM family methyltransferase
MDRLLKHINPKVAIDIGANIGSFTLYLLQHFPDCKVVMVEANPNCERYLRMHGQRYDMVALSNKTGVGELYVEDVNVIGTGASLYKEATDWYREGAYHKVLVPTKRLDDCNYFVGPIDLIKIDVQGSELDIIKGGANIIKNTNFVLAEVSLLQYNEGAPLMDVIVDHMIDLGFCIVDIVEYHRSGNIIFQLDLLFKNQQLHG